MAPEEERRGGPESGKGDFEGCDLPAGRKGRTAGRLPELHKRPRRQHLRSPVVHDDAIREILETVRATAARIDALQDGAAEATARQTKENGNYILDKVKRGEMTWPVTI